MELPGVDDRAIWDLWLSQYRLPLVLAADEVGLFQFLRSGPAGIDEISAGLGLLRRSAEALTTGLAATGFLVQHQERFQLAPLARTYLLPESEFYWIPMLRGAGYGQSTVEVLLTALQTENLGHDDRISRRWERGEMTLEDAKGGNRRMHSHSFPTALGLARNGDFSGVRRLLDVAGGSGCYSIALAMRYPELRCTVADLPVVTADTPRYVERYHCQDRVDVHPFNMFEDPWPRTYDAILLCNILHDWDPRRREQLARSAFEALPSGGRIFIHEILLNDARDGPVPAALFSVMMLGTRGKQLSTRELEDLLCGAGFGSVQVKPTYGYYSLVSASKPG
jgi:acetylserotonin N-methyltransferase